MKGFRRAGSIAALACLWAVAAPSLLVAEDDLQGRFMAVCKDDVDRNNPVWTPEQTEKLCACRTRMLFAEQSKDDISGIVEAAEANELISIPDRLIQADLRYIRICTEQLKKAP